MTRRNVQLAIAAALLCAGEAPAQLGGLAVWPDPSGDAALRRTDTGNNGPILTHTELPDITRLVLSRWQAPNPVTDPYTGTVVPQTQPAHLARIDLVAKGLVNPPGSIGLAGPYNPFQYGVSPIYGFIELDVDQDIDTGGEFECNGAQFRYLANVARYGRRPNGALGARAAVSREDDYSNCNPPPFQELRPHGRSGGDWVLTFCGCHEVHLVAEQPVLPNLPNGIFEAGETMRVVSRFFQKIGGYKCASGITGGGTSGPSSNFQYDPWVEMRFSHSTLTNETTMTLVYPLDPDGAATLTGQPVQAMNFGFSWFGPPQFPLIPLQPNNHHSLAEGLMDVIFGASIATGNCSVLMNRWFGDDPLNAQFLNPTLWKARGIVGTAYVFPEDSFYAWTDTMFVEMPGDMNADGLKNSADRVLIQQRIAQRDGGPKDCDGLVNGTVMICDFGRNFDLHDATGDGLIGPLDISYICPADFNGDAQLTVADFNAFQFAFTNGDPRADFSADGQLTVADFNAFQLAFVAGCP